MAQPPKKGVIDPKTELTFKTLENLRTSKTAYEEFFKAATTYAKRQQALAESGRELVAALQRISQLQSGDISEGINRLAELHKQQESKRDSIARSIQDELINSLQKAQKPEEAEVAKFEADYKKVRAATRTQIAKLEDNSKKAGKKGPEALKQAITSLNDKIREAEQTKADKLRNVLLIERKKYCNFLAAWLPVIATYNEMNSDASKFKDNESFFRTLSSSSNSLPQDLEHLITSKQERTFLQIQPEAGGAGGGYDSYSSSYADSYSYGSYSDTYGNDSFYDSSTSYSTGGGGANLGTCTALYDFAGEQAEDLSFYAGDVINLLKEDDGSGWLTGELNGVVGIFPTSYVQRN